MSWIVQTEWRSWPKQEQRTYKTISHVCYGWFKCIIRKYIAIVTYTIDRHETLTVVIVYFPFFHFLNPSSSSFRKQNSETKGISFVESNSWMRLSVLVFGSFVSVYFHFILLKDTEKKSTMVLRNAGLFHFRYLSIPVAYRARLYCSCKNKIHTYIHTQSVYNVYVNNDKVRVSISSNLQIFNQKCECYC